MRRQVGWAVATAVLLIALPGSALGGAARHAANSQTFPDSLGEDPASADITTVAVSNDDAGLITFKINISNRPALTSDMSVALFLDTDRNASTGDQQSFGAEYLIELDPGVVSLFKWNGSTYPAAPSQSTLIFSYDSTGATIKINATDLGGTKGFNFVALTVTGLATAPNGDADITNAHFDFAPDRGHGTFAYQVLTTLRLSVVSFVKTPASPRAGGVFSELLAANENDTGGPVTQGTVTCNATIAGKHLVTLKSGFANGVATCSWKIPKTAKRKAFKGTITLSVRGTTVTRSYSGLAR
jgi:hypothetical protein